MDVVLDADRWVEAKRRLTQNSTIQPDGCILFTGYRQPNGYGWLSIGGWKIAAHRAAYIVAGNADPGALDVCHRCDVRACINPSHLYAGDRRQNMADCTIRGRHNKPRGALHWCAKLSEADVQVIRTRRAAGEGVVAIAAAFGINHATVSRIARGVWRGEVA